MYSCWRCEVRPSRDLWGVADRHQSLAHDLSVENDGVMPSSWLNALSSDECRAYLKTGRLGRVAVSVDALPVILPVVYRMLDSAIWFFTEPGTKLQAAARDAVVAFEIDYLDDDGGWSVLVIGRSEEITDVAAITRLQITGLRPGAPGARNHLIRIPLDHVSGREFKRNDDRAGSPGYL